MGAGTVGATPLGDDENHVLGTYGVYALASIFRNNSDKVVHEGKEGHSCF